MGKRRKARELALQVLFELEFSGKEAKLALLEQAARRDSHKESEDYAFFLLEKVRGESESLDEKINARLETRKPERVSIVLRSILRMALSEGIHCPEVASEVILNEAIELARCFESEESTAFVNGILEKLLEEERGAKE